MRRMLACLICCVASSTWAEEAKLRDVFELETVQSTRITGFGVAVDTVAILEQDSPPDGVEFAAWLNKIRVNGLGEKSPEWLDRRAHLVPVGLFVTVPGGGARKGTILDCHLQALNGHPPRGLLLPPTELAIAGTAQVELVGMADQTGAIYSGAKLLVDCHPQITVEIDGQPWLSFRLKKDHGWGKNIDLVAFTMDRLQTIYASQFNTVTSKGKISYADRAQLHSKFVALGPQRFRLQVPRAYTKDVIQFAYEIQEVIVRMPSKLSEDRAANQRVSDPYLQSRAVIEASYRKRILDGLEYIPGVKVAVSAQMEVVEGSSSSSYKPKELYASIGIPKSYVMQLVRQRMGEEEFTDAEITATTSEVKNSVERWVQNILPRLSLGEDEYRQVEVMFFEPPNKTLNWPKSVREQK